MPSFCITRPELVAWTPGGSGPREGVRREIATLTKLQDLLGRVRDLQVLRRGRGEIDLAESSFADQSFQPVCSAALGAVRGQWRWRCDRARVNTGNLLSDGFGGRGFLGRHESGEG